MGSVPSASGTVTVSATCAGSPRPAGPVTSTWSWRSIEPTPSARLLRREALPGVEADARAVQHGVLDDGDGELGVLDGAPHALGEGRVLGQDLGEIVGNAFGDARAEQARRNGEDPDAQAAEVAGHGQRHARDAGLGGGVGHLSDLTLEGG